MANYYNLDIIPIILKRFKVNNIIISGLSDKKISDYVLSYCEKNDASYIAIDYYDNSNEEIINDYPLNVLPRLKNFDAIFLNDDPNWYTVFNELQIIKKNNQEFPLVFICHNIFPHKRRDSYINPEVIPDEFLNDFSKELTYHDIPIRDEFYHSNEENTPNNGVLTAIEDFIKDNPSIGMMNIKFLNGLTILYIKNSISKIRLGCLLKEIKGYELDYDGLSDDIVKNKILTNHIAKYNMTNDDYELIEDFESELDEKRRIIDAFEGKIELKNNELNLKNSQIDNVNSKLDLKDMAIKNIESKLVNKDMELKNLYNKLKVVNNEVTSLKSDMFEKEQSLKSVKREYTKKLSKLDNKNYCINCYKEELSNNQVEIEYLKKDTLIRKIFSPLSYVYLLFKSKSDDRSLNFKLYNAIKNSECFDIGFYLNNNADIQNSKWCKFFSPELHYVCYGFDEQRKFNKKYFNRNSKKELLEYILNCKS